MSTCRKVTVVIKNYHSKIVIFWSAPPEYKIMSYNECWYMYLPNNIANIGNLSDPNIDSFFPFMWATIHGLPKAWKDQVFKGIFLLLLHDLIIMHVLNYKAQNIHIVSLRCTMYNFEIFLIISRLTLLLHSFLPIVSSWPAPQVFHSQH